MPVAERQFAVQEELAGFRGDRDQLVDGVLLQRRAGFADARQVLADDAGIDLRHARERLAGAMVDHLDGIEALVRLATAKRGEMREFHKARERGGLKLYVYVSNCASGFRRRD